MKTSDWASEEKEDRLGLPAKTHDLTQEDLQKMSEFQVRIYGELNQETLEAMLVGYMVHDDDLKDKITTRENIEALLDSGLEGEYFDNEAYGVLFDDMLTHIRTSRKPMTLDEAEQKCVALGQTHDKALMYRLALARCHAAMVARRIDVRILVRRMQNHYRLKRADRIIQTFVKARTDPAIGPEKALDAFKYNVAKDLNNLSSSAIKTYDWMGDYESDTAWLVDMKQNPEKYRGYMCGINFIDAATGGFRPGQLTIFVGRHGGYKSTIMMNVAYGLWRFGYNVLYASLEMEARYVKAKLWCRGTFTQSDGWEPTGQLEWSKVYNGLVSEPGDYELYSVLAAQLEGMSDGPEKKALTDKVNRLKECTKMMTDKNSKSDVEVIAEYHAMMQSKPNRLKIINIGQSEKIKPSQIERYVEEHMEEFKPQVLIVDYLALVGPDTPYPDRRDLEVGDVCKRFRAMGDRLGFSTISAAQYKMVAIARMRKYGFNQPEKTAFNTDDIAESNQIGADADNVFMLWPIEGGDKLKVFKPKCRHGAADMEGKTIDICQEHCMISDEVGGTDTIKDKATMSDGHRLLRASPMASPIPEGELGEIPPQGNLIPMDDGEAF